jgi:hypothetical protein
MLLSIGAAAASVAAAVTLARLFRCLMGWD